MSTRFTSLILIFLLAMGVANAQDDADKYKQELRNVNKEIQVYNSLKKKKEKERQISQIDLILINKQLGQKQRKISIHRKEIRRLSNKIEETEGMIESLEMDLTNLKTEYARLLQHAFKTRSSYDKLMFIFAAEDFNQAFRRLKYYQQYTDYRKRQASLIEKTKDLLADSKEKLEYTKAEKQGIIDVLNGEKASVAASKKEKESVIRALRKNEKKLQSEIRKRQQEAKRLNGIIKDIMEEWRRKEAERNKKLTFEQKKELALLGEGFLGNKGKLPWPVEAGRTVKNFGKGQKDATGFAVDVNGIVVATEKDADARAIYDGIVAEVITIPGSGKVVLIKHGNKYTSVYNHLKQTYVKPGDKVKARDAVGKILTDENGDTLVELQVWQGRKELNPALWLAK